MSIAASPSIDLARLAQDVGLSARKVEATVELLDLGNTVPFITRYRKDQTGGLNEEQIRAIQARLTRLRLLGERKQTILRSIEAQGRLTPELTAEIEAADTTKRLEDLYLPYKPRKQTLATVARERGLEPLALEILEASPAAADLDRRAADFVNPDRGLKSAADVLLGVGHILAERMSERADLRSRLRAIVQDTGRLVSARAEGDGKPDDAESPARGAAAETAAAEDKSAAPETTEPAEAQQDDAAPVAAAEAEDTAASSDASESQAAEDSSSAAEATGEASAPSESPAAAPAAPAPAAAKNKKKKKKVADPAHAFRDYFEYSESIPKAPPHRVLAINRGERSKVLKARVAVDQEALQQTTEEMVVPAEHPHAELLRGCARDALVRLIQPSLEREVRRDLTDRAESHAVNVFDRNLRKLLLQPPVREMRTLAIDPGYRSGCKLAALDEFGNLLDHAVVYLQGGAERRAAAATACVDLVRKHKLRAFAIGNGTACRETERFVAELIAGELAADDVSYVIVNEAGASVYSTSRIGREEFPTYDATLRGAISIGRRLQDPLSELVKIDPANIGVGMYQHDVRAKHLRDSLDSVVESCVSFVGVDVNTASPALLRYVAGLNQLTAQRVAQFRTEKGPFRSREQLKEVPGLGEATFVQAAGFLKLADGDNPLDATWIHPESYAAAEKVLAKLGLSVADLKSRETAAALPERLATIDVPALAASTGVGELTLRDIIAQLARPGRDPRESLPAPIFKREILKLEQLEPEMELMGTVLNVVDFGAFVDIGLKDSGLVHVSQLAHRYVSDPHDVVAVGDIVKVWVVGVDKQRRRVSLSLIDPQQRAQMKQERAMRERRPRRPARGAPAAVGDAAPQTRQDAGESGQRKPRFVRKPTPARTAASSEQRHARPKPAGRPRPAKPVVPITKAMAEGREPMRTFGDLKQFFANKQQPEEGDPPTDTPREPARH